MTALAVTLAIQALVSMAVLTVPAMAPALAPRLGVSPGLVGVYVSIVYIGATLVSIGAGPLVIRYGAIRVSQGGLLACAAGLAIVAAAPSAWVAAIGALLIGAGYGPITPASSHLLVRTTAPHRVGLIFSLKQTGVPLGGVLAGAVVPALLLYGGSGPALLYVAALNLTCIVLAQPVRGALDADRQARSPLSFTSIAAPLRFVLADPVLRRLSMFAFVFSSVQVCLAAYLVTFLHTAVGYSLIAAGAMLALAQVGGTFGRVAWGYIADRWLGPTWMLALLAGLMAVCSAASAALHESVQAPIVLVLMVAFGASATGWNGVFLAEVARLAPVGQASAATGGALAITFFGVVVGPSLFGLLSNAFGSFRAGFAGLAVPAAFCAWQLARAGLKARGRQNAA